MGPSAGHLTIRVPQALQGCLEILYQPPNVNVTSSSRTSGDQVRANQAERLAMQVWEPYSHNRTPFALGRPTTKPLLLLVFLFGGRPRYGWMCTHTLPFIARAIA